MRWYLIFQFSPSSLGCLDLPHACTAAESASDLDRADIIWCILSLWNFLFWYLLHFTFQQLWLPHTQYSHYSSQQEDCRFYLIVLTVLHSADWACLQDKSHWELRSSPSAAPFSQLLTSLQFQPALVNSPGSMGLFFCFSRMHSYCLRKSWPERSFWSLLEGPTTHCSSIICICHP